MTALVSPRDGEAFFGTVRATAPPGVAAIEVRVGGRLVASRAVTRGDVRLRIPASAGPVDLLVAFRDRAGRPAGTAVARDVRSLPASGAVAHPGSAAAPALRAALTRALRGAPGYASAWAQDLRTGRAAGIGADARYPAASTVKLALLVGALGRVGPAPEASRYAHDLRAMAGWSSNLATNRLLDRLGGTAVPSDVLRRLDATRSTFTGGYLVGTALQPALPASAPGAEPPPTSTRVTTPRDLGRLLFALHAAAVGRPGALAATGLTLHQARVGLALLLGSEQSGDNLSLVAGGLPAGTPIAQKNGWIRRARHAATILYTTAGPRILVLMTYRPEGADLAAARSLGGHLARALFSWSP